MTALRLNTAPKLRLSTSFLTQLCMNLQIALCNMNFKRLASEKIQTNDKINETDTLAAAAGADAVTCAQGGRDTG